jgi:hypothetical protein
VWADTGFTGYRAEGYADEMFIMRMMTGNDVATVFAFCFGELMKHGCESGGDLLDELIGTS